MMRGALQCGAFVCSLAMCARAFAHGGAPVASAVLSLDELGPRAVSFNTGVAQRRSLHRYQFVCPGAWLDQFPAPLAALPDGTLVVGATRGLMLLDQDGVLRVHPASAAAGSSTDLVRSAHGVFSLRPAAEGSELLAVDALTVRVLWRDTTGWSSLAATADALVLVRANNRLLELVSVSAVDGTELDRQSAEVDYPVDYVFARASPSAAYALVVFRNGTMALGSLAMKTFTKVADAGLSLAGPLSTDNATLLALDGALTQLVNGVATPLADDHNVVCLGEQDGLSYACEREGISRVSFQGVGEPLFRFSWLMPPALELVPEGDARMLCNAQWQDFLLDMQLSMLELDSASPMLTEAISTAGAAGAAAGSATPVQARSTGCWTLPGSRTNVMDTAVLELSLLLSVWRYRRRAR